MSYDACGCGAMVLFEGDKCNACLKAEVLELRKALRDIADWAHKSAAGLERNVHHFPQQTVDVGVSAYRNCEVLILDRLDHLGRQP